MPRHVRYGDYVQAVTVDEEKIVIRNSCHLFN